MSDAQLTAGEREVLREFIFQQELEHSPVIAGGTTAADQLRRRYPGLADEEMAAVVMQVAGLAMRASGRCRCGHLRVFAELLGVISADLAHLDVDARGLL